MDMRSNSGGTYKGGWCAHRQGMAVNVSCRVHRGGPSLSPVAVMADVVAGGEAARGCARPHCGGGGGGDMNDNQEKENK